MANSPNEQQLIPGTAIPVHAIAALSPSMPIEHILEHYPSLTRKQIEDANAAAALTASDVIYPDRTLKRALSDLVSLGVFDDERAPDEDIIPAERQRSEKLGPDYDPHYSEKLEAYFEEAFGPMGNLEIIDG